MKVLILTTDAYGGHGGIALYNRDIAQALVTASKVNEVVVVPRNVQFIPSDVPDRVTFHQEAAGSKCAFLKTVARIALHKYDFVICGHINLLPIAVFFALKNHAPLILLAYGIEVWRPAKVVIKRILRIATSVWTISAFTQRRMNLWAKLPAERFVVIPNAIHLERYGVAPRRADLVNRFGLVGRKVLLTLGRLSASERYKGVDQVLEVLPSLIRSEPGLIYLVAGEGDDRARLEQKAIELGLSSYVVFTGFVAESDKADMYRLADVFVMPSRGEGFGFVFLEAMACGIPVVASCLDGSLEAVRGGSLGAAVDPDDREDLATSILEALAKPRSIPDGLAHFSFSKFRLRLQIAFQKARGLDLP